MNTMKKMKSARLSVRKFEVNHYVCVKTDKVDKNTALHTNVLFGKRVQMENVYARIAVLSIRPGTRRSSGGYSVESRRVYFTAFKYRME